jgi:hypothetical protein
VFRGSGYFCGGEVDGQVGGVQEGLEPGVVDVEETELAAESDGHVEGVGM